MIANLGQDKSVNWDTAESILKEAFGFADTIVSAVSTKKQQEREFSRQLQLAELQAKILNNPIVLIGVAAGAGTLVYFLTRKREK